MPHTSHVTDCHPLMYGRQWETPSHKPDITASIHPTCGQASQKSTLSLFLLVPCEIGCVSRSITAIICSVRRGINIYVSQCTTLDVKQMLSKSHGIVEDTNMVVKNQRFQTFVLCDLQYCDAMFTITNTTRAYQKKLYHF